jgi:hypothetical protein
MLDNQTQVVAEDGSSAIALLEKFTTSAEGIALFALKVITEVEEGRVDPLRVALFMKTMEKIKERVDEKLKAHYLNEAEKNCGGNVKTFKYRGAEITVGAVKTEYDFTDCGHTGWNDLTKIINEATAQRKEYEATLKTLTGPTGMILDGEPLMIKPPVKKQVDGIKISIK